MNTMKRDREIASSWQNGRTIAANMIEMPNSADSIVDAFFKIQAEGNAAKAHGFLKKVAFDAIDSSKK